MVLTESPFLSQSGFPPHLVGLTYGFHHFDSFLDHMTRPFLRFLLDCYDDGHDDRVLNSVGDRQWHI
jgi:hypothetical protein